MSRSANEYADNWSSLFELFVSVSGLKLRINIPDTAIIKEGRIIGWHYTNKEGIVCRCSLHEISSQALFQKLTGQQCKDPSLNPFGYVALAHYESGVSRLVKQHELQEVLSHVVGPYESALQLVGVEVPFCVQTYIVPARDHRYITTYGGPDSPTCTTFARRFGSRYTHAMDDPGTLPSRSGSNLRRSTSAHSVGGDEARALSAEELLVESQLVALGLLEAREGGEDQGTMQQAGPPMSPLPASGGGGPDAALPAPKKVKTEAQRVLQLILSYVERAHGLRVQGMVCEFALATWSPDTLFLLAVHAVQWDVRGSRGRLGTFTERWSDFLNGMGPAPAPRPPPKKNFGPGMLRSADAAGPGGSSPYGSGAGNPSIISPGPGGNLPGAGYPGAVYGDRPGANSPNLYSTASRAALASSVDRPGSAPAGFIPRSPRVANSPSYSGAVNGHYTLRNALSAARRGAGGNPTAYPANPETYALWTTADHRPAESVAGSLAMEVESLKEKLQRQTDIAARAEAALTQLAITNQQTQSGLVAQVEALQAEVAELKKSKREVEADYERLRTERAGIQSSMGSMESEVARLQQALAQDRETLALTVRQHQMRDEGVEAEMARLRADNDALAGQVQALQRRMEEELEVVEAVKAQLFDYRQLCAQLQAQVRRGKSKPIPANANGAGGPLAMAGQGGVLDSRASVINLPGNAKDALNGSMRSFPLGGGGAGAGDGGDASGPGDLLDSFPQGSLYPGGPGGNQAGGGAAGVGALGSKAAGGTRLGASGGGALPRNAANRPGSATRTSSTDLAQQHLAPSTSSPAPAAMGLRSTMEFIKPGPGMSRALGPNGAPAVGPAAPNHNLSVPAVARSSFAYDAQTTASQVVSSSTAGAGVHFGNDAQQQQSKEAYDAIKTMLDEIRKQRRWGGEAGGPTISTQSQSLQQPASPTSPGRAGSAGSSVDRRDGLPNYEHLHLNDLFVGSGEPMSERMVTQQAVIVKMLEESEADLLEIYTFYAMLSQVVIIDNRLSMAEHQFIKFGLETGVEDVGPMEDVFRTMSDRVGNFNFEEGDFIHEDHIFFDMFPEAICRLACVKYEWRPPETAEEADEDVYQPEALKQALRAREDASASGACCTCPRGRGSRPPSPSPTAKAWVAAFGRTLPPSQASGSRTPCCANCKAAKPGGAGKGSAGPSGAASPARAASPVNPRSPSPHGKTPKGAGTSKQPHTGGDYESDSDDENRVSMAPELVLYNIVKLYLEQDVLPCARRNRLSGSVWAGLRSKLERKAPEDLWLV